MKSLKKNKLNIFSSLYFKITAVFLITLLILSFIYLYISVYTAEMYFQEASQRLNEDVAKHIADENQCFLNDRPNEEVIKKVFHEVMVINPSIEVYLLDKEGKILTYLAQNKNIKLTHVPLEPINEFLKVGASTFVMGVDPKDGNNMKGFSVAKAFEGNKHCGYIYVILGGEEFRNAAQFVLGSYMLRLGLRSMSITLAATLIFSFIAIAFITRNLRKILGVIHRFRDGDLTARIIFKGKGELKEFSNSFNSMADTIVSNIDEMKTMDNLRRELVANVSHDLRTPLSAIQGYIETIQIKADSLSEEEKNKYLKTIFKSTERLKTLVSELFELSKLEAKETKPYPEAFSIAELIQDIQQKNKIVSEQKNIEVKLSFPLDLPLVFADIGMIEKVIQNLLDNAIKFTSVNGQILIKLLPVQNFVYVEMQDNGQGISAEDLPLIFDRYQRKKRTGQKENEGLGLGLAIVKRILEAHNLNIKVKSSEGKGTVFSFSLQVYKNNFKNAGYSNTDHKYYTAATSAKLNPNNSNS